MLTFTKRQKLPSISSHVQDDVDLETSVRNDLKLCAAACRASCLAITYVYNPRWQKARRDWRYIKDVVFDDPELTVGVANMVQTDLMARLKGL